ncbi:FERM domain-containing protein 5 isoform X8 [Patella vulgata]|uniref:FERM domain-containing protein 5 isoform X8 n=1 Tax=Patella vulgata TaxID=6465 RepID=UPI00217FC5B5|nr:FERM domain-containing protein 5 isoform X8 [Patella vulgata]
MFRKKSSKSDLQTEYSCSIRFLDDSEPIQLSFKKDTIGQWLLERVCEKLNIVEKDYFGLRYVDSEKQRHWLDPIKTVYKQLKGVNPMVLCFRVKFYPAEPMKLHEEITRYFMFLQLRRDLHHGRLLCSPQDAILLAAYIVQSEVGDYDQEDHPLGYISEFKMLPKQNAKMEEQIMEMHKTLKGQVPSEAEGNFLRKGCTLDTYGVDPHQVKDSRGDQLYLGVTHQGIMTFRGSRRTQLFKWNQIRRLAYEGKMFIAHVNVTEDEETTSPKKGKFLCTGSVGQQPIGYKCATTSACKYLWRCAVEQQLFFTLSSSINTPKVKSGGTLFSRGSKFRFSGRCQAEAYVASENIKRDEPNFARTSSLPNFARKHDKTALKDASITIDPPAREDLSKKYNVNTWSPRVISAESSMTVRNPPSPPRARATPPSVPIISVPDIVYPTTKDRVGESAVDVPRAYGSPPSPTSLVQSSPTVKAPLAEAEDVIEAGNQRLVQASTPIRKENGSAVSSALRNDNLDITLPYNPNMTQDEDDDDNQPRTSLDDQIKQLEDQYSKLQSEPNNVELPDGVAEQTKAGTTGKSTVAKGGKSGCATCCKALFISLFFVAILATVTFYILFYSEINHPIVNDLRKQTIFLEPVKAFVDDKITIIKKALK